MDYTAVGARFAQASEDAKAKAAKAYTAFETELNTVQTETSDAFNQFKDGKASVETVEVKKA